jgi:ubiquinone/menaquinone biosynthesis C-methylase UbiE
MPWLLADAELGKHVLEIGAGAGAATEQLRKRAGRVTSLEYSHALVTKLAQRYGGAERGAASDDSVEDGRDSVRAVCRSNGGVVQGDAAALPFADGNFSAVVAILMLHQVRSREAQEKALGVAFRVLRGGGVFLAVEIEDSWLNRALHIRSTFVPVAPSDIPVRLAAMGFSGVTIERRGGMYSARGVRAD